MKKHKKEVDGNVIAAQRGPIIEALLEQQKVLEQRVLVAEASAKRAWSEAANATDRAREDMQVKVVDHLWSALDALGVDVSP
jgi:hypothetical protein